MSKYPAFIQKRSTGVVTRFDEELWESKDWVPFGTAVINDNGDMSNDGKDFDRQASRQEKRHNGPVVRISPAKVQGEDIYKTPGDMTSARNPTPVQAPRLAEPDTPVDEAAKEKARKPKRAPKAGLKARLSAKKGALNDATA